MKELSNQENQQIKLKPKLKLGKMTMRELSTWFGLKSDSLSKNPKSKEKKLRILTGYADYHFEGKNLIIDEIYIDEFNKAFDLIDKEFLKYWGKRGSTIREELNIDTCTKTAQAIYMAHPEIQSQVKPKTFISYAQRYKREGWGKNGISYGPKGYSNYIYMRLDKDEPLMGEELEKFRSCLGRIFNGSWQNDQILGLLEDYHLGNVTLEDLKEGMVVLTAKKLDWQEVRDAVTDTIGYYPNKETQLMHNGLYKQQAGQEADSKCGKPIGENRPENYSF